MLGLGESKRRHKNVMNHPRSPRSHTRITRYGTLAGDALWLDVSSQVPLGKKEEGEGGHCTDAKLCRVF